MTKLELIQRLNGMLLAESGQRVPARTDDRPAAEASERRLLRSLMNLRQPRALSAEYIALQDELLSCEREEKGVVDIADIPFAEPRIKLWRGDITRLNADAIVNAANSALLGCFCPCHGCIDNAIHSAAGLQLREECAEIMRAQGHEEPTGSAKITRAYNLPCKFVIHTVGPVIYGELTQNDCNLLQSCYASCLALAAKRELKSIAFCCISTGEFHFPPEKAAEIAVRTVREFVRENDIEVVFNVFKEHDERLYARLLG